MKNLFLILILNLFFISITSSQILVSEVIYDTVLVGPEHMNFFDEKNTAYHFKKFEKFKYKVDKKEKRLQSKIGSLEGKKNLKITSQKRLDNYKFQLAKLYIEKAKVRKFIKGWMLGVKRTKTLKALSLLRDDECFEIISDRGTFRNDEVEIYRLEPAIKEIDKLGIHLAVKSKIDGKNIELLSGQKIACNNN